ncbi:hypothetical protein ColLi_00468 [Colletotrichum liriopes]|uniref:Uncharacterized protein n=1 Tax=Colletotrichum liriopes TaxID=708192 RepID=A0AA37GB60_9PEZI|nr:hypothetical protein ColLi_00468 [Colletotrichum liriopes]
MSVTSCSISGTASSKRHSQSHEDGFDMQQLQDAYEQEAQRSCNDIICARGQFRGFESLQDIKAVWVKARKRAVLRGFLEWLAD